MQIPYVIDNIEIRFADVLNYLLQREQGQQVDIATVYFSIHGFEQPRNTLPGGQHFRLLLGDKPAEGEDIGVRPESEAYLRHELNAELFTDATLRLVEKLIRFLRSDDVALRLYLGRDPHESSRNYFLHTKYCLIYGGGSFQSVLFDHLHPIVDGSNFTGPVLISNRELNLMG